MIGSLPQMVPPVTASTFRPKMTIRKERWTQGNEPHVWLANPVGPTDGTTQLVGTRFRFGSRGVIETHDGEVWRIKPAGPANGALRILERDRGLPAASDHGTPRRAHRTDPEAVRFVSGLGLTVSPRLRYVRWHWRWWTAEAVLQNRLLLHRRSDGRDLWAAVRAIAPAQFIDSSIGVVIPYSPPEGDPIFIHDSRSWHPFYETEWFTLIATDNKRIPAGLPAHWLAVAHHPQRGWQRLFGHPQRKPIDPVSLPHLPHRLDGRESVRVQHPNGQFYDGLSHTVRFTGGPSIRFILPDPASPAYPKQYGRREFVSLVVLTEEFSRLPRWALRHGVETVTVFTRGKGGALGQYDRSTQTVTVYPKAFGEADTEPTTDTLRDTIWHEVLGHGGHPRTKAFTALWVGAMLVDGRPLQSQAETVEEDFALAVEHLWNMDPAGGPPCGTRLSLLRYLNYPERPLSARSIREAMRHFRVIANHLVWDPPISAAMAKRRG